MRLPLRILTLFIIACALCFVTRTGIADEYDYGDSEDIDYVDDAATEDTDAPAEESEAPAEPVKEEPPPPRTFTLTYDANGGTGQMDPSVFTEGQPASLSRCTYTRSGYTFEGWTTEPDGSGQHFPDGVDVVTSLDFDAGAMTLYAQWGSQIYLIRYANGVTGNSSTPAEGTMPTQFAVHDAEVALLPCGFTRTGYVARGWMDSTGTFRDFSSVGTNFVEGTSTTSWEVATIGVELVRGAETGNFKWSCQGSVVFTGDDGAPWAAVAFINYDSNYRVGSLETYDSEIIVCSLTTGELKKHASGLMLEHANDIAYNPANGHFYIAQGGLHEGLPDGIVELDENLNEVRTVTPAGTNHIWNITYSNGIFYAIGNVDGDSVARGNPEGTTSDLIRLDEDLNVIDMHAIDFSSQGFSGQGMACDGDELYAILVNFAEADAANKQRLSLFTLDGEARGTQYIDIPHEVESASWLNDRMYFSINGGASTTVYGTDLASTTMTCVWRPNVYNVAFDVNGVTATSCPDGLVVEYDQAFALPIEKPVSPGYVFTEWNSEPDGTGTSYRPGEPLKNLVNEGTIILYAQWSRPGSLPFVADNGSRVKGMRFRPNARERLAKERKAAQEEAAGPSRRTQPEETLDETTHKPAARQDPAPVTSTALTALALVCIALAAPPDRRQVTDVRSPVPATG